MQIEIAPSQDYTFILAMFNYRTALHTHHLCTTSFAKHAALNDLYEAVTELTDKYAETHMGVYGQYSLPTKPITFTIVPDIVATLDMIIETINAQRTFIANTALLNILDELSAAVSQAAYKIKYLN